MLFDLVLVTFVVVSYFQRPFLAFRLCVLRDKETVCVGRARLRASGPSSCHSRVRVPLEGTVPESIFAEEISPSALFILIR